MRSSEEQKRSLFNDYVNVDVEVDVKKIFFFVNFSFFKYWFFCNFILYVFFYEINFLDFKNFVEKENCYYVHILTKSLSSQYARSVSKINVKKIVFVFSSI